MCRFLILAFASLAVASCFGGGGDDNSTPILFVAGGVDEYRDIFSLNPEDGTITNLTNHPAHDLGAAWSPDGSKIAFLSTRDEEIISDMRSADIYVMDADGSNVERIASIEGGPLDDGQEIVWNPDGERLLYGQYQYQPLIVSIAGNRYEPPTDNAVSPVWSQDGRRIVYFGLDEDDRGEGKFAYWAVDPYSLEREKLFSLTGRGGDSYCQRPHIGWNSGWSVLYGIELSTGIAVRLNDATGRAIYRLPVCVDGVIYDQIALQGATFADESVLTDDPSSKHAIRWSPDGSKIAYMAQAEEAPSVWVMNADGSEKTPIAEDAGQPVWSPNGEKLAFVGTTNPGSYRRDEAAIFVANADGSDVSVLADDVGWVYELEWSPVD